MPDHCGASPGEGRRRPFPPHLRAKLDPDDLAQEAWLRAHRARGKLADLGEAERLKSLRKMFESTLADQVRRFDRSKRHATRERSLSAGPDGQPTFPRTG